MSYPQSPPPSYQPPPMQHQVQLQQPVTDKSKRFLNLSGGALMAVIAGVILVCCGGPIAFCFASPFFASIGEATKPKASVTITDCQINSSAKTADVTYTIENTGKSEGDYRVKLTVSDASGSQVGDATSWVFDLAGGAKASKNETVFLDAVGNVCKASVE